MSLYDYDRYNNVQILYLPSRYDNSLMSVIDEFINKYPKITGCFIGIALSTAFALGYSFVI